MNTLRDKRVLVTGASGFIASHLTRRLVEDGADVGILTKYNSVIDNVRIVDLWDSVRVFEADIRNYDSLRQVRLFRPDVIFHFAAYNHVGDSFLHISEAIDCNIKGTVNVVEAYEDYSRFVYISTSEVYGYQDRVPFREDMCPMPISPYAIGKYGGELYCRMKMERLGKPIVVLRPFNAFGPYQSPRAVIAEMALTCLRGLEVRSTAGKQTRDFNYVENLVDGFILAALKDEAVGKVINIGSGAEISIRDLITKIHKETDSSSELRIGALPDRPTEIWRMCAANGLAKSILGWEPRFSFEEGLSRTVQWYMEFEKEFSDKRSLLHRLCKLDA